VKSNLIARHVAACLLALLGPAVAAAAEVPQPVPEPEVARAAALLDAWSGNGVQLQQAARELEAALQRHPDSAPAYRELARLLVKSGMINSRDFEPGSLEQALAALDHAIQLAPDYAAAHVLRGHVLTELGRLDDADRALDQAAAIGTADPWLLLNRAGLRLEQGRFDEAGALCGDVSKKEHPQRIREAADDCLVDYFKRSGQADQADAAYRRLLAYDPGSAWRHGNYARFLLCTRNDTAGATREARAALAIMDYGHARNTLAQALYRDWAVQWEAGRGAQAQALFDEARTLQEAAPEWVMVDGCGGKLDVLRGLAALYRSGYKPAQSPAEAIARAQDADKHGTPGVFEVVVRGTGRDKHNVYANSLADYRDPHSLTVRIVDSAAQALASTHGQPAEALLMGKRLVVAGYVRRERIAIHREGQPDGHYFQTHLWVTDAAQVLEMTPAGATDGESVVSR
jgi:Tfp pilus assembly protein PilF